MNTEILVPDALIVPADIADTLLFEDTSLVIEANGLSTTTSTIETSTTSITETSTLLTSTFFKESNSNVNNLSFNNSHSSDLDSEQLEENKEENSNVTNNSSDSLLHPNPDLVSSSFHPALYEAENLKSQPAKYWPAVAYTAAIEGGPVFSSEELSRIPVGIQNIAINIDSIPTLIAETLAFPLKSVESQKLGEEEIARLLSIDTISLAEKNLLEKAGDSENYAGLTKSQRKRLRMIQEAAARKYRAREAINKKASRKLLLAERSKKIVVTCEATGLVIQMDIPAIPGFALIFNSPLADLSNCRGIAQRGRDYLLHLDTQVLAAIAITISESYELFVFEPYATGSWKNAVLRTAESQALISSILLIEGCVHSQNHKYLPKLSFLGDTLAETINTKSKLINWNRLIAETLAAPDKSELNLSAKPQYPIRPVFVKDVEKKLSFMRKDEEKQQKAQLKIDQKEGRIAINTFCALYSIPKNSKDLMLQIIDNLLVTPVMVLDAMILRFETKYATDDSAKKLIKILSRNRSILVEGYNELLSEDVLDNTVDTDEEEENETQKAQASDSDVLPDVHVLQHDKSMQDDLYGAKKEQEEEVRKPYTKDDAPAVLSSIERIVWAKKMNASLGLIVQKRAVQNTSIPSVVTYVPSDKKQKLGEL